MDLFSDEIKINDLDTAVKLFRESRAGFLKLFDTSPVCMSMTTTVLGNRRYARVNNKFLEKFQYTESEIIGKTSIEIGILDFEESERVRTLIAEKGRLQNDYVKCRTKSGEIVHTVSSIEFMEINSENFLVSFFIDITKIIEQQAVIERHLEQLEAVNRELEAFSYTVSHDLRAPLRAIDGFTKILEEDFTKHFDENGLKLLASVQRNARKMGMLIDDLLGFAKLGKQPIRKTTIDMNTLVADVLNDLNAAKPDKTKIIVGTLHPMHGDYGLIKQVMTNLISNGIKYSSKKDNPVVEITSKEESGGIIYTVHDNGAGFDMNYAQKLFGVFQRLHQASEFEGTGVGLATVQRIVSKHGGTIHAESELGKSSTFYFKIPINEN